MVVLFLVSCRTHNSGAQTSTSGGLTGVVTDPSLAVVPGAMVEITDRAKGTTHDTETDRDGAFRFFFVAPGRYTLTVTRDGFRQESRTVSIVLGLPGRVNVTLQLAKKNTTVKVTAEASLIQAENGDFSSTVSQKQISEIPNPGNDLTYIVQTEPGVVMDTDPQGWANFSSLGMPATSTLLTVNGMNDNENGYNANNVGSLNLLLGQNQVQEATVVSIGYSGQFGGAAGANVNYITKSGSNEFHGNAQYYWNGSILNANGWFNNATSVARPANTANQWAGSFGGPIKKDKLFFFLITKVSECCFPRLSLSRYLVRSLESRQWRTSTHGLAPLPPQTCFTKKSLLCTPQLRELIPHNPAAGTLIPIRPAALDFSVYPREFLAQRTMLQVGAFPALTHSRLGEQIGI